ncbi:MAG: hypothetical protein AAF577_08290 [Pseudomonadota bacterium]
MTTLPESTVPIYDSDVSDALTSDQLFLAKLFSDNFSVYANMRTQLFAINFAVSGGLFSIAIGKEDFYFEFACILFIFGAFCFMSLFFIHEVIRFLWAGMYDVIEEAAERSSQIARLVGVRNKVSPKTTSVLNHYFWAISSLFASWVPAIVLLSLWMRS